MSNSSGGSLDRAFEELIQRVVETTMTSVRADLERIAGSTSPSHSAAGFVGAPVSAADGRIADLHQASLAILLPTGQTDIMSAALKASSAVSGTAALFVRRGDNFTTWRSEGLSAEQAAGLRSLSASAASSGAFQDVCDGPRSVSQAAGSSSWPAGLNVLAGGAANICLMPVLVAGKVVAAIAASADGTRDSAASLELIARITGLSLETSGTRAAATSSAQSAASTVAAAPAPSAQAAAPPAAAPVPAAATATDDGSRGSFADIPAAALPSDLPPLPDVDALPDDQKESHKKAHRFARVAVQDLLSYHKAKIADGRNNRNLYDVLREDIEKTRENYQKKYASTAAGSFDYLHYELIAKLAGNDPAVLGGNYPGPVGA